jgi:hypothetical protein
MGLIIKPKGENKIIISGTDVELPSVYARLVYRADQDGKTMEIGYYFFTNKEQFKADKIVNVDVPQNSFHVQLAEGESQTLEQAQICAIEGFNKIGFNAEVEITE